MSERKFKYVGTRPIRHDGLDKVTGKAEFGADQEWPNMLWGAILRSPHAHARIRKIDASKARSAPGVKAVLTGPDMPKVPHRWMGGAEGGMDFGDIAENVLARDKGLYHGLAVAAVAATSLREAQDALALIQVDYEPLEAVFDVERAIAPGAPILHPEMEPMGHGKLPSKPTNIAGVVGFRGGDLDAGFREAELVLERTFRTPMVHQGYIEPHACIARTNADGKITIWCCTQGAFMVQGITAMSLGLDPALIKVIPSEIGGGFGAKTTIYLEPLAVELSRRADGRPVKLVMSREEVFRATGPTSGTCVTIKLGAKRDGTLVAAHARLLYEAGAYRGSPVGPGAMTVFGAYKIPNFEIEGFDIVLNKPKVAAYRAPGAPMANFAMESVMDELARELRIDPIELRLKNAVTEGCKAPYGPKYARIGLVESLQAAKQHPHYKAPVGKNCGRGIAAGFWFNAGMQSSAIVSVNNDGSAVVRTGNPDIGGSRASMAIMCAEELGIPVERIRPLVGDTESVGYSDLTGGSRVTFATGMAVIEATRDVVRQLRERAAKIWGCNLDDVKWEDGMAIPQGAAAEKNKPLPLVAITAQMGMTGGPIIGKHTLNAPMAGPGFAVHLCDLEVDPETGRSEVVRYTAIQDAGKAVHPSYVEGQMQGGASQGIGWALNEEYVWDAKGVVENPSFLDYRMPVASDLPMIDTVVVEVPNPTHPYGVRGVGETPIVPPLAAVANAMRDATGIRFEQLPLSPPVVLAALQRNA
jgi:CO/xanthine dehydrogenase Mo-binding subunit